MNFNYPGYELNFIQRKKIDDGTAHQFTLIYKFYSPITRYNYVLTAEYHQEDIFAIKFYCKKDKHSRYKYSKIVNKGDLGNILITCAKVIPLLLQQYPTSSFGFIGSRTVDMKSKTVEGYTNNQRFRNYKYIIKKKFGSQTFAHFEYPDISAYLLINRLCGDIERKERAIMKMVSDNYVYLPDLPN